MSRPFRGRWLLGSRIGETNRTRTSDACPSLRLCPAADRGTPGEPPPRECDEIRIRPRRSAPMASASPPASAVRKGGRSGRCGRSDAGWAVSRDSPTRLGAATTTGVRPTTTNAPSGEASIRRSPKARRAASVKSGATGDPSQSQRCAHRPQDGMGRRRRDGPPYQGAGHRSLTPGVPGPGQRRGVLDS